MTLQARGARPRNQIRVKGFGVSLASSLYNDPPRRVGSTDRLIVLSFTAAKTGSVIGLSLYFEVGSGYASGTGGAVRFRVYPDDGGANHYPNMAALPVAEGTFTPNLNNGQWRGAGFPTARDQIALPFGTVKDVVYHIVAENVDADPVNNWISINNAGAVDGYLEDQQQWADAFAFRVLMGQRTAGAITWSDQTHAPTLTTVNHTPNFQITYSDGVVDGLMRAEMAVRVDRTKFATSSVFVSTRIVPPENWTVGGHSIYTGFRVGGSMLCELTDASGAVLRSWIYSGASYTEIDLGSYKLVGSQWFDQSFEPIVLVAGQVYYIDYKPLGGAEVAFGQVLDWRSLPGYAPDTRHFTAQHFVGGVRYNYDWAYPAVNASGYRQGGWQDVIHLEIEGAAMPYNPEQVIQDMLKPHDARPHAFTNYPTWSLQSVGYVAEQRNTNPTKDRIVPWFEVCQIWGRPGVPAPNSRVEVRGLKLYQKINNVWQLLFSMEGVASVAEKMFVYDWSDERDYNIGGIRAPAFINATSYGHNLNTFLDNGGTLTIWHNYRQGGVVVGGSFANIFHVQAEIRKTLVNPAGVDDRANVPLVARVAADWYNANSVQCGEAFHQSFSLVPNDGSWKLLTATNMTVDRSVIGPVYYTLFPGAITEAELRANPPPLPGGAVVSADPVNISAPTVARSGSVIRVRVTTASGAPAVGAVVTWVGESGGVIYGVTNAAGVVSVRLLPSGLHTLRAAVGGNTKDHGVTITPVTGSINKGTATEDLTNAAWTIEGAGSAKVGNNVSDIYGGTTFDTFTQGTGNPALNYEATGMAASGRKTLSMFLKRGSHDWACVRFYLGGWADNNFVNAWFNLATGRVGALQTVGNVSGVTTSIEEWGNGLYRVTQSIDGPAPGNMAIAHIRVASGDNSFVFPASATLGVGGLQVQEGNLTDYEPVGVVAAPVIVAKSLLPASNGANWSDSVTCSGQGPITWSISSGALPAGITANTGQTSNTLTLSGAPVTATAGSTFSIRATNASGADTKTFVINVVTLSQPSAPTLTTLNSDTLKVDLGQVDGNATHVQVFLRETAPAAGFEMNKGTFAIADFPIEISDLTVGATYSATAQASAGGAVSAKSAPSSTARLYRLFVIGHFHPEAVGVSGVSATVGRGANPGGHLLTPTEVIAAVGGITMEGPVTYVGKSYSKAEVPILAHPASGKLRNGDRVDMVIAAEVGGKAFQSKILHGARDYGALVREGV